MSASEFPDDSNFNPFEIPNDSLELGRVLELRQVFERYLKPELLRNDRKSKTVSAVERHIRRFEEWWDNELAYRRKEGARVDFARPFAARISSKTLTALQRQLVKDGRSSLYANQTLRSIRQVLLCAERHGLITHAPRFTALPAQKSAPKIYLTDDQLVALWNATPALKWPDRRRDFRKRDDRKLHYTAGTAWRCCLVLWVMYGLRTQDLIALEAKSTPITWANFTDSPESPNPVGYGRNQYGWLSFTPSKDKRGNTDYRPLYLPLNLHARCALERLKPDDWTPEMPICNWTFSSSSFYDTWRDLVKLAGITSKAGEKIDAIHLRKTCVTRIEDHRPGMSGYIVGHAADGNSKVTEAHYNNAEKRVLECITTIKLPSCFDEILLPLVPSR